jgi:hypothetical protein
LHFTSLPLHHPYICQLIVCFLFQIALDACSVAAEPVGTNNKWRWNIAAHKNPVKIKAP